MLRSQVAPRFAQRETPPGRPPHNVLTPLPGRPLLRRSFVWHFTPQDSVTNFYVSRKKGAAGLQNMLKGMLT